ncbi:hypothetical protein BUALT_Bualt02G0024000 [Buddleja alternifolia]|uniref:Uncharacterized protein n=1 Tax=Buddleja alternifolia TaxID=168488 RepID=A0AAV6XXF5_9LAMI|nr:hypothetical protein BUALT_Bualt02G0024000 [Buddleja alternifolia]
MPRQNMNLEGKIGGRKCRVRKRRCSSSSSSSLVQNYRLKRAFLVGKRGGSSTPVPIWKMMSSKSPSLENVKYLNLPAKSGEKGKNLPVSARKLAATLWEINGMSEIGIVRKERVLELGSKDICFSDLFSERMDQSKVGSHRRRASAGSHKLLQADNLGSSKSLHNCLVEVDQTQNQARSPCRHIVGSKNRLKDVYNGLITSKELLKVMSRICRFEQQNSTSLSLFSALKFELDRACIHVNKLILEQKANRSEVDNMLKQFEEEKLVWKLKEQDRIRGSIMSIAGELEVEKKLRRQTERLNNKLGRELADIKESLSRANKEVESEKRAREILEQVCDELARGIGEDRAEVEELKKQSEKVREEVEKEREMLQLADVIREERVQMKLSEAKYQFEEKNALVDKLRNELEAYLKAKTDKEKKGDGSPSYDKIKELEKYLRETLPGSHQLYRDEDIEQVNKEEEDEDEDEDDDDDSGDSDLHSIELNVDDLNKSFQWRDGVKNKSKRNSVDKTKGRKSVSEKTKKRAVLSDMKLGDGIEWEFTNNKQGHLEVFDGIGPFEFASKTWKKDVEDEMERYNMIKDLRDHIVSGSRMGSSQQNVSSKDPNEVVCQG